MSDAAKPKVLPKPNSDFYQIFQLLNAKSKRRSSRFANSWRPLWLP
jgi:hypothetical protein